MIIQRLQNILKLPGEKVIMLNRKHKLAYEILGIVGICTLVAVILFLTLSNLTLGLIEEYLFHNDIILKDDEYFLLGDNRLVSQDSRNLGPVKEKYIEDLKYKNTAFFIKLFNQRV